MIQQEPTNQPSRHVVWEPRRQLEEFHKNVKAGHSQSSWEERSGATHSGARTSMELRPQGMRPSMWTGTWAQGAAMPHTHVGEQFSHKCDTEERTDLSPLCPAVASEIKDSSGFPNESNAVSLTTHPPLVSPVQVLVGSSILRPQPGWGAVGALSPRPHQPHPGPLLSGSAAPAPAPAPTGPAGAQASLTLRPRGHGRVGIHPRRGDWAWLH